MKVFLTIAVTFVGTLLLLAVIGLIVIYSGWYDVSATQPHGAFMKWTLHETMENSVERRAGEVVVPDELPMNIEGVAAYDSMCRVCHGAPGLPREEIGQGINPQPPNLTETAEDMTTQEIFWITKHGIKMAGMPAFGVTHSDEAIWRIVAFVESIPELDEAQYMDLLQQGREEYGEHEEAHSHEEEAEMHHAEEAHSDESPSDETAEHEAHIEHEHELQMEVPNATPQ